MKLPDLDGLGQSASSLRQNLVARASTGITNMAQSWVEALAPTSPTPTIYTNTSGGVLWGGRRIPFEHMVLHFLVLGATGSGKTTIVRILLQDILPRITPGSDWRMLLYDPKTEFFGMVKDLGLSCPVRTLNPFDARGCRYDIAQDATNNATLWEVARILIPDDPNSASPFFPSGARLLGYGVLLGLHQQAPGTWTFRDFMYVMRSPERIRALLDLTADGQDIHAQLFGNEETLSDLMATIATKIIPYQAIAALWDRKSETVSIRDWINSESVLLLGNHHQAVSAVEAVNRALMMITTQHLLSLGDSPTRRTFIVLDEASLMGNIELLPLMLQGRSRGVSVILLMQGLDLFRKIYGEENAKEILGQPAFKAFLRMESLDTARWCSEFIGQQEILQTNTSENWSYSSSGASYGTNASTHHHIYVPVLPSELMKLPVAGRRNGLYGYYKIPDVGFVLHHYEPEFLYDRLLIPPVGMTPNFIGHPDSDQVLQPWTPSDLSRLGLPLSVISPGDPACLFPKVAPSAIPATSTPPLVSAPPVPRLHQIGRMKMGRRS